jgi:hypothetical protein
MLFTTARILASFGLFVGVVVAGVSGFDLLNDCATLARLNQTQVEMGATPDLRLTRTIDIVNAGISQDTTRFFSGLFIVLVMVLVLIAVKLAKQNMRRIPAPPRQYVTVHDDRRHGRWSNPRRAES